MKHRETHEKEPRTIRVIPENELKVIHGGCHACDAIHVVARKVKETAQATHRLVMRAVGSTT